MSDPLDIKSAPKFDRVLILGHAGHIGIRLEKYFKLQAPDIEIVGKSVSEVDLTKENEVSSLREFLSPKTAVIMCSAIKKQLGDNE